MIIPLCYLDYWFENIFCNQVTLVLACLFHDKKLPLDFENCLLLLRPVEEVASGVARLIYGTTYKDQQN